MPHPFRYCCKQKFFPFIGETKYIYDTFDGRFFKKMASETAHFIDFVRNSIRLFSVVFFIEFDCDEWKYCWEKKVFVKKVKIGSVMSWWDRWKKRCFSTLTFAWQNGALSISSIYTPHRLQYMRLTDSF